MSSAAPHRPQPLARADFARFIPATSRWMDNDAYGHINNVVYYSFFDTAVNRILIEEGVLDPVTTPVIGLVVETCCTYFESLKYPDDIEIGVRAIHIGRSSVRYSVAVFKAGGATACAQGEFTHVYVDRASGQPCPIPERVRAVLEALRMA